LATDLPPAPESNGITIRADNVGGLLDTFIILAMVTILIVRSFLWLTGYPQIGGGTLHIAHMLWGGLLMTAALILMQSIILRWARRMGAVLGGIGFGLFIDELGKFITKDNDYFFRPTFALIYILFMILYFSTRYLLRSSPFSPQESLVNALELMKNAAIDKLTVGEKARAEWHLLKVPNDVPVKLPLAELLAGLPTVDASKPFFWEIWGRRLAEYYMAMISSRYFAKLLALFFLGAVVFKSFSLKNTLIKLVEWHDFGLIDAAMLGSNAVTWFCVLVGDWYLLRGKRATAYLWLERGLIVAILIGQVFVFGRIQLPGILWLGVLLTFYAALRVLMAQEKRIIQ